MTTYSVQVSTSSLAKKLIVAAGHESAAAMIASTFLMLLFPEFAKAATEIKTTVSLATYDEVGMAKSFGNQDIITEKTVADLSAFVSDKLGELVFCANKKAA